MQPYIFKKTQRLKIKMIKKVKNLTKMLEEKEEEDEEGSFYQEDKLLQDEDL